MSSGAPSVSSFSTSPLCLTDEELRQLTGKQRAAAQRRALQFMAIDHKCRPDGSLVVLRDVLAVAASLSSRAKRTEPNWD